MTWCLEKHLKNISINVRCVFKDGGQGRGNMEKYLFAFKRNDIKGSNFMFTFYYLILQYLIL